MSQFHLRLLAPTNHRLLHPTPLAAVSASLSSSRCLALLCTAPAVPMAAVVSNEAFFADVRRLFVLLDLDADGQVDITEATLGLSHCFEAVHHINSPTSHDARTAQPPISASHKQQAVANQVNWLFSATHHSPTTSSSPPAPLQSAEFIDCYHRLLQSGYEPEVLHVDLSRAIQSLQSSHQWQSMGRLLRAARRLFGLKLASTEATVQRSDIEATFRAVLTDGNGSWSFASGKRRDAVRAVVQRLLGRAGQLTEAEWLQGWKDILSAEFDYAAAARDVDAAAGVSTEAVNGQH